MTGAYCMRYHISGWPDLTSIAFSGISQLYVCSHYLSVSDKKTSFF